ncbi:MAG: 50S ribosomal protein L6 [bacterium]|nr:50S ribosomal protein L6 [bacterium]
MSKIGKKPIEIPKGVEVKIEGQKLTVKGPKGELTREVNGNFILELEDKILKITPKRIDRKIRALWGLQRSLIFNMTQGVVQGFEKKLEIEGVGYRASLDGRDILLNIGFSHPVRFTPPEDIKIIIDKNVISVSGIDKALVGQVAASIRALKKPEPYKGKGIHYSGEKIRRKAGKKLAGAAG